MSNTKKSLISCYKRLFIFYSHLPLKVERIDQSILIKISELVIPLHESNQIQFFVKYNGSASMQPCEESDWHSILAKKYLDWFSGDRITAPSRLV